MQHSPAQTSDVKADFELVEKIGSRKAYEALLGTHRTGPYADLARMRIREMGPDGRANAPQGLSKPTWGDDTFIPRPMDRKKIDQQK